MLTRTKHLWAIVDDPTANKGIFVATDEREPGHALAVYAETGVTNLTSKIRNVSYMGEVDVEVGNEFDLSGGK